MIIQIKHNEKWLFAIFLYTSVGLHYDGKLSADLCDKKYRLQCSSVKQYKSQTD